VRILKPITFASDGLPNGGAWKESFPISGCGNDTTLNFYFVARADEKINTIVGFAGSTIGDPQLQRDALFYASLSAGARAKDCKTFDVKNTKFEAFGVDGAPDPGPTATSRRPWRETWTMVGCDHTLDVTVNFIPDATGTTIVSPVNETIER
jgi:hypothetical protein